MPSINTYGIQRLVSNLSPEEQIQWEDEDGLGVPPANMRDAADDAEGVADASLTDDYGNGPNAGPQSAMDRYRDAVARKVGYESSKPQRDNYRPKGWQRALAAVANFGAGYVNAGGRVKVDPHAMDSLNDALMRPGYRRAMENWQDQGAGVNAGLQQAGSEMQMESAAAKAANEARRITAYENAQKKSAELAEGRLNKLNEPPDPYMNTPVGAFDRRTGTYITPPPKSPGRPYETPDQAMERKLKHSREVLHHKEGSDEQLAYLGDVAAMERIKSANRPAKGGKGGAGKPRMGTMRQFDAVDTDADKEYAKAEAEALKKLKGANISGFDDDQPWAYRDEDGKKKVQEVDNWLTNRKNQIADKYAKRVKGYGGSAEAVKYKPVDREAGNSQPQANPAAPTASAPKYDEKTVRESAIKAGKDPEYVVAEMKKRGLL